RPHLDLPRHAPADAHPAVPAAHAGSGPRPGGGTMARGGRRRRRPPHRLPAHPLRPAAPGAGAARARQGAEPAACRTGNFRPGTPGAPAAATPEVSTPAARPTLEGPDYNPLLQAIASRALDTCLRGARGLAVLGDPRAFGLLLQLSREDDAPARVEVCRALAA